jgi:hypothetical protein
MSAISGFGSAVQGLYQSFQNLQAAQSSGSSSTNTANAVGTIATDVSNTLAKFAGRHGHHGGGLRTKIEAAVQGALANVAPGTEASDVDQTIQNAIASVLKNVQNGTPGTTSNTNDPTNPTDETDATTDSTDQSEFASFLQQHGVSLSEFQADLQAAFKNAWASGQTPDTSSIFSQLPTGSELDVTA